MPLSDLLALRARMLSQTREFFRLRNVMEVETPIMSAGVSVDSHVEPIMLQLLIPGSPPQTRYLQTSPELHMKRLLAQVGEPMFQISKVFRNGEVGQYHNPEFTMIEWYRPDYLPTQLMAEVEALLQVWHPFPPAETVSFQHIFEEALQINPHTVALPDLQALAYAHGAPESIGDDRDGWLNYLFAFVVQPTLGQTHPVFVTQFPVTQANFATVSNTPIPTANRFELFYKGMELCNGYEELRDPLDQQQRLEHANAQRIAQGLSELPVDQHFLDALRAGIPPCSGVALGFDRIIMAVLESGHLHHVLAFPEGIA